MIQLTLAPKMHRLWKRQSVSTTTIPFRTTVTRTIILNLLTKSYVKWFSYPIRTVVFTWNQIATIASSIRLISLPKRHSSYWIKGGLPLSACPPRSCFCLVTQCSWEKRLRGRLLPNRLVELWSRRIVGLSKRKEEKGKKESEKLF